MTRSVRSSTDGGTVRPSVFTVFRFTMSARFMGCSIGRSPGLRQVIEVRRRRARRCVPPIAAAVALLLCAIATAKGQGPEVKVIEIEIGDNMRYAPYVIDAEPCQKLWIVLSPAAEIKPVGHK